MTDREPDESRRPGEPAQPEQKPQSSDTAKAVGRTVGKKVAEGAAKKAAETAATSTAAAAASSGASAAAGAAAAGSGAAPGAGAAMSAAKSVASGDTMGAVDAGVKAAATAAASTYGTPLAGAAVGAALETEPGRRAVRGVSWIAVIAVGALLAPLLFGVLAGSAILSSVALVGNSAERLCVDPVGGGLPVSDTSKQAVARQITQVAYDRGYGKNGAIVALMVALAESALDPKASDPTVPADTPIAGKPVGVFQQKPFVWAPELWPAGTVEGDENYNNIVYAVPAAQMLLDPAYATGRFFDALEAHPSLKDGKWKTMKAWTVAQSVMNRMDVEGVNYSEQWSTAKSTVATVLATNPQIGRASSASSTASPAPTTVEEVLANGCGADYGAYTGWGDYALAADQVGTFVDGPVIFPNTDKAIARALSYVGRAEIPCPEDRTCYQRCDHLSGDIWGYEEASGYVSARRHWFAALAQGVAHPGDTTPPIGALLFWDTGVYGHVATYVGNGYVVTNLAGPKGYNVYKVPASYFSDKWGAPYYGWAEPWYHGQKPGSGL